MTEISFGFIDRRVMAAVERVAASDPDPGDPFRGLYISDEVALRLSQGDSSLDADGRLQEVVRALGLDLLEAAVLAVCAATELNPRYGRLYAYLQDDVTRKLPSPRLVGQLLEGEGLTPADVMVAFDAQRAPAGARRAEAARRRADAARRAADQDRRPARRRAARRAHGRVRRSRPGCGWSSCPSHAPGRQEAVETMAALLARESHLPIVLAGPDADTLIATALGRPMVAVHVRDLDRQGRDGRGRAGQRARGPADHLRRARGRRAG